MQTGSDQHSAKVTRLTHNGHGVPPNVQAQINQANSYMKAGKTVKDKHPSYAGWASAIFCEEANLSSLVTSASMNAINSGPDIHFGSNPPA